MSQARAPKFHERTHQTMLLALKIILVGILCAILLGCTGSAPTAPQVFTHPNEILLDALVQCCAAYHGLGHLAVRFFDDFRPFVTPDGQLGFVAGGAWPGATWVEFYHPWVLEDRLRIELAEVAAHEVAHVSGVWGHGPVHALRVRLALEVCS